MNLFKLLFVFVLIYFVESKSILNKHDLKILPVGNRIKHTSHVISGENSDYSSSSSSGNNNNIHFQWYTQKVDHFDSQNTNTFKQRYLVNNDYWDGKGPVFLAISGENEMTFNIIAGFQYVNWAKKVNALIISLEHRYYGESLVSEDMTTDNLKYLTTEQVIADMAEWIEWLIVKENIGQSSKFIGFGGSYSGVLLTDLVIKYPNIINSGIASSAPVQPTLNFYQYLEVTQNAILSVPNIGEQCLENIISSNEKLVQITQDKSLSNEIFETFNLCHPLNGSNDVSSFLDRVAFNWMYAVQYNDEEFWLPSIEQMCTQMVNDTNDPFTNYVNIWKQATSSQYQCIDVSYDTLLSRYTNTSNDGDTSFMRLWQYTCCTEFGFFITSDAPSNKQPFGNNFGFNYQSQICQDVFGIPNMLPNINFTLSQYGGLTPTLKSVENILFVSGTNDPYSIISISPFFNTSSSSYNTAVVQDGAHCADMLEINQFSVPDIARVQALVFDFINKLLNK